MFFKPKKNAYIKALGYSIDQDGIINRYIREKENWDLHLEQCKRFILDSAANKKQQTAMILGSGWWLDIPTEELCQRFENVFFVDIVHPSQMRHKASKYKNLTLIETEISGFAQSTYQTVRLAKKQKTKVDLSVIIPQTILSDLLKENNVDFVVSLNLLNQLDILIVDYVIENSNDDVSEHEIQTFREQIQSFHIQSLPKGKSCIISDYQEKSTQLKGTAIQNKTLVHTAFPVANRTADWIWLFDSQGYYVEQHKTIFQVKAIDF